MVLVDDGSITWEELEEAYQRNSAVARRLREEVQISDPVLDRFQRQIYSGVYGCQTRYVARIFREMAPVVTNHPEKIISLFVPPSIECHCMTLTYPGAVRIVREARSTFSLTSFNPDSRQNIVVLGESVEMRNAHFCNKATELAIADEIHQVFQTLRRRASLAGVISHIS